MRGAAGNAQAAHDQLVTLPVELVPNADAHALGLWHWAQAQLELAVLVHDGLVELVEVVLHGQFGLLQAAACFGRTRS
eukprot:10641632-Alexandrium_andersonii.AAC.1